ncbi:MAG: helix-turn-helix transcriptional regulator [Clostridia bacterium]|nr:helix-turn-helix transcriptional regulator [Clostridia bacterium]
MYKNQIREYRKQKGMNLYELADKAGISTGYLCHLEKGTRSNPSIQVMEKIAKVLGKNIAEIFFNT